MDMQVRLAVPYHLDPFSVLNSLFSALGFVLIALSSPSTDHSTPFSGRPKIKKLDPFRRHFLSHCHLVTNEPWTSPSCTALFRRSPSPVKQFRPSADTCRVGAGRSESRGKASPISRNSKNRKIHPAVFFSPPATKTQDPQNCEKGTGNDVVEPRPVSRNSENRKTHRAALKAHGRASRIGKSQPHQLG
ncbi:hypothetical protein D9611_009821 [Ephemerocybe angulata]|uniref:Uncharacterized protein n=1 Tax=Ephemerocybe angulata TaxID=980116 RepID=A0A8H5CDD8_9AGAR|nr:hypothetical protein D9611_009821 [Tulosesus angulatus]